MSTTPSAIDGTILLNVRDNSVDGPNYNRGVAWESPKNFAIRGTGKRIPTDPRSTADDIPDTQEMVTRGVTFTVSESQVPKPDPEE